MRWWDDKRIFFVLFEKMFFFCRLIFLLKLKFSFERKRDEGTFLKMSADFVFVKRKKYFWIRDFDWNNRENRWKNIGNKIKWLSSDFHLEFNLFFDFLQTLFFFFCIFFFVLFWLEKNKFSSIFFFLWKTHFSLKMFYITQF